MFARLSLTLVLLALILTCFTVLQLLNVQFDAVFWSSLLTGLIPNLIAMIVGIFIVDALIRKGRTRFYEKINETLTNRIRMSICKFMFNILIELEILEKPFFDKEKGVGNDTANKMMNDLTWKFVSTEMADALQNGNYHKAIEKLADKKDVVAKLKKLEALLQKESDFIRDDLHKLAPYPDPLVISLFTEKAPDIVGGLRVMRHLLSDIQKEPKLQDVTDAQNAALRHLMILDPGNKLMRLCEQMYYLSARDRQSVLFTQSD